MTEQYRWPHAVATGLACAAVAYQTAVIWEALSGVSTTTKLGVPLATVSAAILPVLAEAAWKNGHKAKALLMSLPVLVLLAYVLPSGVSRLGEHQANKIDTATKSAAEYAAARADLDKSTKLVEEAEKWVASECRTGRGTKCRGVEFIQKQREAYKRELQAKVDAYKPVAQPWLPTWHPATLTIGLELAIVGALFYGLGPLVAGRKPEPVAEPEFKDSDLMPVPVETDIEKRWIAAFRESNGRIPTQKEVLARFPYLPKSTASVWRRQVAA